jgi:PAS domain S-box-containing protein
MLCGSSKMETKRTAPVDSEVLDARNVAEAAALRGDARYRAVFEAADDAVLIASFATLRVLEANPAACDLFARSAEDFAGLAISELHAKDDEAARECVERELGALERVRHPNLRLVRKDGAVFWGELRATVFQSDERRLLLLIVRDVSERVSRERELARALESLKDAQTQLVHAGKLAAVGQLAAGVAHEVNNPATFILTNLKVMREHIGKFRAAFSAVLRDLSGERPLSPERRISVESQFVEAPSTSGPP